MYAHTSRSDGYHQGPPHNLKTNPHPHQIQPSQTFFTPTSFFTCATWREYDTVSGMKSIALPSGKVNVSVYHNESTARLFCGAKEWIVMGDACEYWVCKPVVAGKLEKAGYEIL